MMIFHKKQNGMALIAILCIVMIIASIGTLLLLQATALSRKTAIALEEEKGRLLASGVWSFYAACLKKTPMDSPDKACGDFPKETIDGFTLTGNLSPTSEQHLFFLASATVKSPHMTRTYYQLLLKR